MSDSNENERREQERQRSIEAAKAAAEQMRVFSERAAASFQQLLDAITRMPIELAASIERERERLEEIERRKRFGTEGK